MGNVLTSRKIGTVFIDEGGILNDAESVGTVYVVSQKPIAYFSILSHTHVFFFYFLISAS